MSLKIGHGLVLLAQSYENSSDEDEAANMRKSIINPKVPSDEPQAKKCKVNGESMEKNQRLLVPATIQSLPSVGFLDQTASDVDSEAHQGRSRTFPHVRGNWSSFVYVNFSENDGLRSAQRILQRICSKTPLHDKPGELILNQDLHLSLTKTLVFRHHWIAPFVDMLSRSTSCIGKFDATLKDGECYVNEENTRTFIGMEVFPSPTLLQLVEICDTCLQEYELEPYYENPSFHVSLGWILGNQQEWVRKNLLQEFNDQWSKICSEDPVLCTSRIKHIDFKSGNRNFIIPLRTFRPQFLS